jgi:hypothetical protein
MTKSIIVLKTMRFRDAMDSQNAAMKGIIKAIKALSTKLHFGI